MTRDLEIRGIIDPREAERGAKAVNKAQDSITKRSEDATRKMLSSQTVLTQKVKEEERARKQLDRTIEGVERKSSTFGLRGLERLRAQKMAQLELARAAGASAAQVDRIGAAYDRMAARAEASERRARFAAEKTRMERQRSADAVRLGGIGRGAIGGIVGAAATIGITQTIGGVLENTQRLSELSAVQAVLARNSGLAREALQEEVEQIKALNFSTVDALEATTKLAATGMPSLIRRADELAVVGRNVATVMGGTVAESLDRLTQAIVKEELAILDTTGLQLKWVDGYKRVAAELGKNATQLTEQEKLQSRFDQVIRAGAVLDGSYEAGLVGSAGAQKQLNIEWSKLNDNISRTIEPEVTRGLREFTSVLGGIRGAFEDIGSFFDRHPNFAIVLRLAKDFSTGAFTRGLLAGDTGEGPMGPPRSLMNRTPPGGAPPPAGGGGVARGPERFTFQSPGFVQEADIVAAAARRAVEESLRNRRTLLPGALAGGPLPSLQLGRNQTQLFELTPAERLMAAESNAMAGEGLRGGKDFMSDFKRRLEEEAREVERQNERLFSDLKRQSGELFDAMLAGGRGFWNYWKNLGLTAIKDVFSSAVASQLMGITGGRGPAGAVLGGFGGFGSPGAPGGTSGFAGPVASLGGAFSQFTSRGTVGQTAARGAGAGGALGLAGLLNPGLIGLAGAYGLSKIPTGGNRAVGGALGGLAGGIGVSSAFALNPALLGLLGVPGANIAVAAGIGVGVLLGTLRGGAKREAKKEVKRAYGVDLRDDGILQQIIEIGKSTGGNLAVAVQTPAVRELVTLYSMATGQGAGPDSPKLQTGVLLTQRGGQLYQSAQYANGAPTVVQSRLPTLGVRASQPVNVIQLDAQETRALFAEAAAAGIARSPQLVADASLRATKASSMRRQQSALLMEPFTATSS